MASNELQLQLEQGQGQGQPASIEGVEIDIRDVQSQIEGVENEIKELRGSIKNDDDREILRYLITENNQLRRKEEQLRTEKELLLRQGKDSKLKDFLS